MVDNTSFKKRKMNKNSEGFLIHQMRLNFPEKILIICPQFEL